MIREKKKKEVITHTPWLAHQPRPVQLIYGWLEKNRKLVVYGSLVIAVVGAAWGGIVYYQHQKQIKAADLYAVLPLNEEERKLGLARIAQKYPDTGAGILARFILGKKAFEAGQYDEAARLFKTIKGLSGKQAMIRILALHNLAAVHEAQGEWEKALDIYRRTAADPSNRSVIVSYYHLGRVSETLGRKEEAAEWFRKVVKKGAGLAIADRAKDRLIWLEITKSS